MKIAVFCILGAIVATFLGAWLYYNHCVSKGKHYVVLGRAVAETKSRVPKMSRYIVEYSLKGQPYNANTKLMKSGSIRVGSKAMWDVSRFKVGEYRFTVAAVPKAKKTEAIPVQKSA